MLFTVRKHSSNHAQKLLALVLAYEGEYCVPWPYNKNEKGYGRIGIDGRPTLVSRLACERENGPPPTPKHQAAHSCGNGHLGCVTRLHLSWKTHKQNMEEAVTHGTISHGEVRYNSKLTEDAIREIRQLRGKVSQRKLGARFGVSHTVIGKVQHGEDWAHINSEE